MNANLLMQAVTATSAESQLLEKGVLGVCVLGLALTVVVLARKVSELQEARVAEAKAFAEKLDTRAKENGQAMLGCYDKVEGLLRQIQELRKP